MMDTKGRLIEILSKPIFPKIGVDPAEVVAEFLLDNDIVPIVRCKDCKYQDDCERQMVHRTRDYVLELNRATYNKVDFCSYGERKSDENNS